MHRIHPRLRGTPTIAAFRAAHILSFGEQLSGVWTLSKLLGLSLHSDRRRIQEFRTRAPAEKGADVVM